MASWDDINNLRNEKRKEIISKEFNKRQRKSIYAKEFGLKSSIIIMGTVIGLIGAGIYYLVGVVGV